MKNRLNFKLFMEILFANKKSILLVWLFYFLLSNIGTTPYKIWWLLIISGIFSLVLHVVISFAILYFKRDEHESN